MTQTAARRAAGRHFGNRTLIEESSREAWMFNRIEALLQDLRYGLRLLRRSPGFTVTAVSVITLGLGANTAAFTLLDHVLIRPLPFAHPDRLVMLYETQPANGVPRTQTSPPNFLDWREMSRSFESMGAYVSVFFPVNLSGRGDPLRLDASMVNSDVFLTLGVQPSAGRVFTAEDEVKALWRVQALDPGFRTEGVLTLRTALPVPKYGTPAARRDFYQRVMSEARALPGFIAAAYVSYHPMERASGTLSRLRPLLDATR